MSETKCLECNINSIKTKCHECDYLMCIDCNIKIHSKENKNNHNIFLICDECEDKERKFECTTCDQKLCVDCDIWFHKKGNRAKHSRDFINELDKYNIYLNLIIIDYTFNDSIKKEEYSLLSEKNIESVKLSQNLNKTMVQKNDKFKLDIKKKINTLKNNLFKFRNTIILFPNKLILKKKKFLKYFKNIKFIFFEKYYNCLELKEFLDNDLKYDYNLKNLEIYSNKFNKKINKKDYKNIFNNSKIWIYNNINKSFNNYSFLKDNNETIENYLIIKDLKFKFINENIEKNKKYFNIKKNPFDENNIIINKIVKELEILFINLYNKGIMRIFYKDILNKIKLKTSISWEACETILERLIDNKFLKISRKQIKKNEYLNYIYFLPDYLNYEVFYWIIISLIYDKIKLTLNQIINRLKEFFNIKLNEKEIEIFMKNYSFDINNISIKDELLHKEIEKMKHVNLKIKFLNSEKEIKILLNKNELSFDDVKIIDNYDNTYNLFLKYLEELFEEDLVVYNTSFIKKKNKKNKFKENSINNNKSKDIIKGFLGGKYSLSNYIIEKGPTYLKKLSLGMLLNLTQLAINNDFLAYNNNFIYKVKFEKSNIIEKEIYSNKDSKFFFHTKVKILSQVKDNLIKILENNNGTFPLSKIKEELEKLMDIKIDLHELGFSKLNNLINEFKETFEIKITNNNYFINLKNKKSNRKSKKKNHHLNFNHNKKKSNKIEVKNKCFSVLANFNNSTNINKNKLNSSNYENKLNKILNILIHILKNHTMGIEINLLKKELNKKLGYNFNYENFNFSNFSNFSNFLMNIGKDIIDFEIKQITDNKQLIICYPKNYRFGIENNYINKDYIKNGNFNVLNKNSSINNKLISINNINKIDNNKEQIINYLEDYPSKISIIKNNKNNFTINNDDFSKNFSNEFDLNLSYETFLSHGSSLKNFTNILNNSSNSLFKQFQGNNTKEINNNTINTININTNNNNNINNKN